MARCKSCGEKIQWARNEKDRGVPLNPTPNPEGRLALVEIVPRGEWKVRHVKKGETLDPETVRYEPHQTTCPDEEEWRRKREERLAASNG